MQTPVTRACTNKTTTTTPTEATKEEQGRASTSIPTPSWANNLSRNFVFSSLNDWGCIWNQRSGKTCWMIIQKNPKKKTRKPYILLSNRFITGPKSSIHICETSWKSFWEVPAEGGKKKEDTTGTFLEFLGQVEGGGSTCFSTRSRNPSGIRAGVLVKCICRKCVPWWKCPHDKWSQWWLQSI